MTATPHNGKEEDFQLFLSLLDSDRFYGKFRDGVHKVDASDLMRRMVKEETGQVRRHAAVPGTQGLHRQLQALRHRGRALRSRHQLRADGNGQGRPARRLAQRLRRLRPHRPPAPPRLQPRGDLPIAQAPQGTPRSRLARGKARHPRPANRSPRRLPMFPKTMTT